MSPERPRVRRGPREAERRQIGVIHRLPHAQDGPRAPVEAAVGPREARRWDVRRADDAEAPGGVAVERLGGHAVRFYARGGVGALVQGVGRLEELL